ncbi:acetate--CoA ligase family protein, partial [Enterococcus faecalis]
MDDAAAVVAAISRLLAERPEVAEWEVNPLGVGPDGPVAVDALVIASSHHDGGTDQDQDDDASG